jgi:hypothetical protein
MEAEHRNARAALELTRAEREDHEAAVQGTSECAYVAARVGFRSCSAVVVHNVVFVVASIGSCMFLNVLLLQVKKDGQCELSSHITQALIARFFALVFCASACVHVALRTQLLVSMSEHTHTHTHTHTHIYIYICSTSRTRPHRPHGVRASRASASHDGAQRIAPSSSQGRKGSERARGRAGGSTAQNHRHTPHDCCCNNIGPLQHHTQWWRQQQQLQQQRWRQRRQLVQTTVRCGCFQRCSTNVHSLWIFECSLRRCIQTTRHWLEREWKHT